MLQAVRAFRRPRHTPAGEATSLAFAFVSAVLGFALWFGLQRAFDVEPTSFLFFAAVLAIAGWLGVWSGLLAAVIGAIAANLAYGGLPVHLTLRPRQDLANFAAFAVGAWVAGLYIDEGRRGREAVLRVARSVRPTSGAGPRVLQPLVSFLYLPRVVASVRFAAACFLTMASAGFGLLVARQFGLLPVSMIYLAGVVLSASLLGTRYAIVTAVLSTVAYDYVVMGWHYSRSLDVPTAGLNLVLFLGVGWRVGLFTDRVRYEREIGWGLLDASRRFSGASDEGELHRQVCEAISAITGGRYVAVWDDVGKVLAEQGELPSVGPSRFAAAPRDGAMPRGLWRTRSLPSQADSLNSVVWIVDEDEDERPVEAAINVLVDLAASAINRAHLTSERAELQARADAEHLRRALLASLSHDVRTPLAGILGSATTLLDNADRFAATVRQDLLANIRDQAYRLDRYLENLLGMTRLEAGVLQANLVPVSLEAVVYDTWEGIAAATGNRRPLLHIDPDVQVMADPGLLRQALGNVIENAIKFSPSGAPVEVRSELRPGAAALTVQDCGPGVAEADLEKLFLPFFRTSAGKPGVGLGLFIARSFVEAMGGELNAMPRKDGGNGLRFELTLPLVGGDP